jgi:hypothetical protein
LSKYQRYRKMQRLRGMKLVRIWLPDPHSPEFAAEARRQGATLRGRAEETEALAFIASAFEWPSL